MFFQAFASNYLILACASGWISFGHTGHCYQHFSSPKSWDDARSFCQSAAPHGKEGDLASAWDRFTNTFLATITSKYVWIGGHQNESSGEWQWSDGTRWRYSSWASNQPNDENQKHVAFNFETPGGWNDLNGNSEKGFLCQYKGKDLF